MNRVSTVVRQSTKQLSTRAFATKAVLPDLPYDYNELEPVISAKIMELHHSKHHATYVNNYNALTEQYAEAQAKNDVAKLIALQQGIKFNGGGHVNHSIFWTNLAPPKNGGGGEPTGALKAAIEKEFGSFEAFKTTFNAQTAAVQGSGWGWLGYNPTQKRVQFAALANQDPLSTVGLIPLLGVDVWEHAYYLDYKNVRPDYLKAIWEIVNWKNVEERFAAASK